MPQRAVEKEPLGLLVDGYNDIQKNNILHIDHTSRVVSLSLPSCHRDTRHRPLGGMAADRVGLHQKLGLSEATRSIVKIHAWPPILGNHGL